MRPTANLEARSADVGVHAAAQCSALRALIVQCAAAVTAFLLLAALAWLARLEPSLSAFALLQAFLALRFAHAARLPWWWLCISFAFVPALLLSLELGLQPGWSLGAFALLVLVFWSTFRTQVPLYFSSRHIARSLLQLLPAGPGGRFIDLGCGLGGMLTELARLRPDCEFDGVELAPLPFLAARLRACLSRRKVSVRYGDFFHTDLSAYRVVYAFLSPVPMARLWDKAVREMRPGSLLVSNSFEVPGVAADRIIRAGARGGSTLYVWRF